MKTIVQDEKHLSGKPRISGTRMPVQKILGLLAQGYTVEEILDDFPFLKREQIYSALRYAQEIISKNEIHS